MELPSGWLIQANEVQLSDNWSLSLSKGNFITRFRITEVCACFIAIGSFAMDHSLFFNANLILIPVI